MASFLDFAERVVCWWEFAVGRKKWQPVVVGAGIG